MQIAEYQGTLRAAQSKVPKEKRMLISAAALLKSTPSMLEAGLPVLSSDILDGMDKTWNCIAFLDIALMLAWEHWNGSVALLCSSDAQSDQLSASLPKSSLYMSSPAQFRW